MMSPQRKQFVLSTWSRKQQRMEDVIHGMNEEYKVCGILECILSNRVMGINMKLQYGNCVNGMVCGMRSTESRGVNVLLMKCLRCIVGVT